jgi:hypothetical protein
MSSIAESERPTAFCHTCATEVVTRTVGEELQCVTCAQCFVERLGQADLDRFIQSRQETNRETEAGNPDGEASDAAANPSLQPLLSLLELLGGRSPELSTQGGRAGDYAVGDITRLIDQLMQSDMTGSAPPTSAKAIEELSTAPFSEDDASAGRECPVCQEEFEIGAQCSKLPCAAGHQFHPDCILPWLKAHNTCPVCRFELPAA